MAPQSMSELSRLICRRVGVTRAIAKRDTLAKREMVAVLCHIVNQEEELGRLRVALKHTKMWEETKRGR
jgi:hypothetical protein